VTTLEEIAQRLGALETRVNVAEKERDEYRALYLQTMERCRKLEMGLLGQKSEKLRNNDGQLSLDVLSLVLEGRKKADLDAALAFADAEQEIPAHKRRKPTGRKAS